MKSVVRDTRMFMAVPHYASSTTSSLQPEAEERLDLIIASIALRRRIGQLSLTLLQPQS